MAEKQFKVFAATCIVVALGLVSAAVVAGVKKDRDFYKRWHGSLSCQGNHDEKSKDGGTCAEMPWMGITCDP